MTSIFRLVGSMMVAMVLLAIQPAQAQNKLGNHELNVPATLVAETQKVPAGQSVTLAFVMKPKPTWHGYWENPGDAGIGMSFDWTLPAGVTAGKARYPVPETLLISGIMNYVYEGQYAVLVNLVVSETVKPGPLPISVKSEWLACTDEVCVPEQDELSIELQVVGKDSAVGLDKAFNEYRNALPRPLGSNATFGVQDDVFRLAVPLPASQSVETPYFFIKEDGVIDYGALQKVNRDGDSLIIETAARGDEFEKISGVLKIGPHMGLTLEATKGNVEMSGISISTGEGGGGPANFSGGGDQSNTSLLLIACGRSHSRRATAQYDALRVSDIEPESDESRQSGRR